MKRLIVNADDFGLHDKINEGIIKGFREGFITSCSVMPGAPAWEQAAELARENPSLGVGVHLTLVGGVASVLPKEKLPGLTDAEGLLPYDYVSFAKRFYAGAIAAWEVEAELRAQIEKALAVGLKLTHIDSHQHTHVLPGVNKLVLKLMSEYNIGKMRIPREPYFFGGGYRAGVGRYIGRSGLSFFASVAKGAARARGIIFPDHFFGMLAGGNLNARLVGNILRSLPEGTSEIMTHPGADGEGLGRVFPWRYHWQDELEAYLDAGNKSLLEKERIALISFADL